jgi:hypothetical protein
LLGGFGYDAWRAQKPAEITREGIAATFICNPRMIRSPLFVVSIRFDDLDYSVQILKSAKIFAGKGALTQTFNLEAETDTSPRGDERSY